MYRKKEKKRPDKRQIERSLYKDFLKLQLSYLYLLFFFYKMKLISVIIRPKENKILRLIDKSLSDNLNF